MGFGVAPREVTQGNVQRIMYLHVPSVVGRLPGLRRRVRRLHRVSRAPAPRPPTGSRTPRPRSACSSLGITIATGRHLGQAHVGHVVDVGRAPDQRRRSCSSCASATCSLRGMVEDRERGARYAAVLGHRRRPQHPARALLGLLVAHAPPAAVAAQARARDHAARSSWRRCSSTSRPSRSCTPTSSPSAPACCAREEEALA